MSLAPLLALAKAELMAVAISLTGLTLLSLEEELYIPILTLMLGHLLRRRSANVVTSFGSGEKRIVVMAHYDSAKAAYSFNPRRVHMLRRTIYVNFFSSILVVVMTIVGVFLFRYALFTALILSTPLWLTVAILIHRELFHNYVPGANDNASGVAVVLGLAESLKREEQSLGSKISLYIVFTGAEEVGMLGSYYFRKYNPHLLSNAIIINVDNPGFGKLYLTECEGVVLTWCSNKEFRTFIHKFAKSKGINTMVYKLLPTDATPLMRSGYKATSLMAFANGMIKNYHWYSDTADGIDSRNLAKARDILLELIKSLAIY
ncbi:M28 family peptidase [Ignisphaera sp. 4213-co]|uniref:M28 family peptidase n=1 Tax=Ignisphaera cupida TaxID=3050454 RepID=A0ABD4Z762_9CREN|nr:M28 family peptidase [Ignisphaera sp. 4213-co]MDK6029182.1 M28 family peptidase [Ignisphaera sp. 4213-co]